MLVSYRVENPLNPVGLLQKELAFNYTMLYNNLCYR
jgi:hypothetical protein